MNIETRCRNGFAALMMAVLVAACGGSGGDTPDTGNSTPDAASTTPDGGDTTPDGGDTTPDGGDTTPDGGDTTPDGGDTTPDGGDTTPDGGDTTPDGGDTTPDGGNTTPDSIAANQIEEAAIDAYCTYVERCGWQEDILLDQESCVALMSDTAFGRGDTFDTPAAWEASVAAGKVTFDGEKAASCFAALAAAPCEEFAEDFFETGDCADAFVGTVGAGGDCIADVACAEGFSCVLAGEDNRCVGTCTPRNGAGCRRDEDCGEGNLCVWNENGPNCFTPGTTGAHCAGNHDCAAGLFCAVNSSEGGTCETRPGLDAPCPFNECANGLACTRSGETSVCRPMPGLDDSCLTTNQCGTGLVCVDRSPEPTCTALPGDGAACTDRCADGLACIGEGASRTCVYTGAAGSTCSTDQHCRDGLACVNERCAVLPGNEETCTFGRCGPGLICGSGSICVTAPGPGESCQANGICTTGATCDFTIANGTCMALPGDGQMCRMGYQCAEGTTCRPSMTGMNVCRRPAQPNEACEDRECVANYGCSAINNGPPTCQPLPTLGQSCRNVGRCANAVCNMPERLPADVTCEPLPGRGEQCANGQCAEGLWCRNDNTCTGHVGLGQSCANDSCEPGLVCIPEGNTATNMTCRAPKGPGEACQHALQCGGVMSPYICDLGQGICVKRPGPGQQCALVGTGEDTYGFCNPLTAYCDPVNGTPLCHALKQVGQACESDEWCGIFTGARCEETSLGNRCLRTEVTVCEP